MRIKRILTDDFEAAASQTCTDKGDYLNGSLNFNPSPLALNIRVLDKHFFWAFSKVLIASASARLKRRLHRSKEFFSVDNVSFEKHVVAVLLREVPSAHWNVLVFFINYLKYAAIGVLVLAFARRHSEEIVEVSLGNVDHWNGILIDYFLIRPKVKVSINLSPSDHMSTKKQIENLERAYQIIRDSRSGLKKQPKKQIEEYMAKRLEDPVSFGLLRAREEGRLPQIGMDSSPTVVIYSHAFSDPQMTWGTDGFRGVYDWLSFTLSQIEKNYSGRVLLKAHPNYFVKREDVSEAVYSKAAQDKFVWAKVLRKLPKRFEVIDWPENNGSLLRTLDPLNTVLISHHGNAVVEGAFMGFQTISSTSSPWGTNYLFSNTWSNRKQYLQILRKLEVLPSRVTNLQYKSVLNYCSDFYMTKRQQGPARQL